MIFPSINELSQEGKYNRYEIALATAKCARIVTNEYVRQRTVAERAITGNKETDRPLNAMIDRELRDEKAVNVAINRIYDGDFIITHKSPEEQEKEEASILEGLDAYDEGFDAPAEEENRLSESAGENNSDSAAADKTESAEAAAEGDVEAVAEAQTVAVAEAEAEAESDAVQEEAVSEGEAEEAEEVSGDQPTAAEAEEADKAGEDAPEAAAGPDTLA
jgi:hypothetical protein